MWQRYRRFLETPPALTLEWHDGPTGARGWLVINSLRGGAAGGGTRMRKGLTQEEVVYLAKCMEMKFAFSGPPIGGAKSGIDFDPADPRRGEVLRRWFHAVQPYLATRYGTGGDMNVDEQKDVEPICRDMGLEHPQEGIVRGHLRLSGEALRSALSSLHEGVKAPVRGAGLGVEGADLNVSDLITGWGTARAAVHCLETRGEGMEGKRVVVEGFGNVGGAAALYLARAGARVVGLVDSERALVARDGLDADDVADLIRRRRGGLIPEHPGRVERAERGAVWGVAADLFVPAAVGGSVDESRLDELERAGVSTIVSGANHPFHERQMGDTAVEEYADRRFEIVPDVVGSMGMARAFHFLMTRGADGGGQQTGAGDGGSAGTGADGGGSAGTGADGGGSAGTGADGGDRTRPEAPEIFHAVAEAMHAAVDRLVEAAGGERRGMISAAVGLALTED